MRLTKAGLVASAALALGSIIPAEHAGAMKDPPLSMKLAAIAAPAVNTAPASPTTFAIAPVAARRIYNAGNVSCWRFDWSKTYRNYFGDVRYAPYNNVEWCFQNYVHVPGATTWCGTYGGFMTDHGCTKSASAAGNATRRFYTDWSPSFGQGWFTLNYDIDLTLTLGPGSVSGTVVSNL